MNRRAVRLFEDCQRRRGAEWALATPQRRSSGTRDLKDISDGIGPVGTLETY